MKLKVEATLEPTIHDPLGGKRWLEGITTPPLTRQQRNRSLLTLSDGVLSTVRAIRDCAMMSVISHGGGGIVLAASLSAEIRAVAYAERKAKPEEVAKLEEAVEGLRFAVLVAPHAFPIKTGLAQVREYLPKVNSITVDPHVVCFVLVPTKDSVAPVSRQIANFLHGSQSIETPFPGLSYRTLPKGLKIPQLKEFDPKARPADGDKKAFEFEMGFQECMAGSAVLTQHMVRYGFVGQAFERKVVDETGIQYIAEGDLVRPENQKKVKNSLVEKCFSDSSES